jgi:hypothetical protein
MFYVHNSLPYGELNSDEQEQFEDTNGVIRHRKTKKDIQCNGRKKKNKHRGKTIHRKIKIEKTNLTKTCSIFDTTIAAATMFFEIYMLPTMDTGQALRIVTR